MSNKDQHDDDARRRLLNAAGPIFADQGFEKATVREICRSAAVNIASVGYYFGDKMGLYREVVREVRDNKDRRFPIPDAHAFEDPEQRLLAFVRTLLQRMLSKGESSWQVALLMREMQQPTGALDDIVQEHFQPVFDELRETLRALLPHSTTTSQLDHLGLSVIGQCFHYRVGQNTIHRIIDPQSLKDLNDLNMLAVHITSVTLAAADGGEFLRRQEKLRAAIEV